MNRTIVEAGRSSSLKERLRSPEPVLAPGVYDALSALLAEQAGFEALYLSGGAVAYTLLGRSDVGLTTATETADVLARIADRVSLPIIVDGDTGYGNALNTQRTVRAFERAGAAMIQLEDQGFPKRCGHLAGKSLVSTAEMCGKLRAALDARHDAGTLILARTDAVAVEGLDAAIERAEAYLACGVDALFVEAVVSAEDMGRVCERFAARIPCSPIWSKAARPRSRARPNSAGAAIASSSFRAAPYASPRASCNATSRASRQRAPRVPSPAK